MLVKTEHQKENERKIKLGEWGEEAAINALITEGFENVENLNRKKKNSRFADVYAQKDGHPFIFSVKTRNKYRKGTDKLNEGYNLLYAGKDVIAKEVEQAHKAKAYWIAVQVDKTTYSVYMGSLDELTTNDIRLRKCMDGTLGRCLIQDQPHGMDYNKFGNR